MVAKHKSQTKTKAHIYYANDYKPFSIWIWGKTSCYCSLNYIDSFVFVETFIESSYARCEKPRQ